MWLEGGLTYKKCDLHVHSSSCESRSYSYGDFRFAILESDLDVVAITDHNMIDLELINDLADAMEKAGKKLLAGAELNIKFDDDLVEENRLELSNKSQYFHGIVWCDVEDAEKLQEGSVPNVGVAIRSARAAAGRPRRSNHPQNRAYSKPSSTPPS